MYLFSGAFNFISIFPVIHDFTLYEGFSVIKVDMGLQFIAQHAFCIREHSLPYPHLNYQGIQ